MSTATTTQTRACRTAAMCTTTRGCSPRQLKSNDCERRPSCLPLPLARASRSPLRLSQRRTAIGYALQGSNRVDRRPCTPQKPFPLSLPPSAKNASSNPLSRASSFHATTSVASSSTNRSSNPSPAAVYDRSIPASSASCDSGSDDGFGSVAATERRAVASSSEERGSDHE